jgi:hypothetical protein
MSESVIDDEYSSSDWADFGSYMVIGPFLSGILPNERFSLSDAEALEASAGVFQLAPMLEKYLIRRR